MAKRVSDYGVKRLGFVKELVPANQDPSLYLTLVSEIVLGRDKDGNLRPFADLALLLYQAKRMGLDPLAKQIYGVYRWDTNSGKYKMSIQVGIDGLRATAHGTQLYAGSDDAIYTEANGKPKTATVTVYKLNEKTGERMPTTATARWEEYVQINKKGEPMGMWGRMPYLMLAKCAESLALRKAFPTELSGVYSDAEMPADGAITDLDLPPVLPPVEKPAKIEKEAGAEAKPKQVSDAEKKISEAFNSAKSAVEVADEN